MPIIAVKSDGDNVTGTEFNTTQYSGHRGYDITKTASFTALVGVGYFTDTSTVAFTATLPDLSSKSSTDPEHGARVILADVGKNWSFKNLTVAASGSDTVEGSSTFVLNGSQGTIVECIYNATSNNWFLLKGGIISEVTRTINFDNSMSASTMQGLIDSVNKYIPSGTIITFQFADGSYVLSATLTWRGFFGGGDINIQGNITEPSATVLHTNQLVFLDFTSSGSFIIQDCSLRTVTRNLHMRCIDGQILYFATGCSNIQEVNFCYARHVAKTSTTSIGVLMSDCSNTTVSTNFFTGNYYAIRSQGGSMLLSIGNDDTSTLPNHGLFALNAAVIGKDGTQPAGSISNELITNGGTIR